MQPISVVGAMAPQISGATGQSNSASSPAIPFKDLLAEALSNSRDAVPSTAVVTTAAERAQAALSAAGELKDAVIGAYNEIKDLRI